jgi:tetratricopeptide (TPR) repeat protein
MLSRRRNGDSTVAFRLLVVMRAYAHSQLPQGEMNELRRRHAAYFLGLVGASIELAFTPRHAAAVERLAAFDDDLLAALDWALETDPSMVSPDVAAGLVHYWYRRGRPADAYRYGHRLVATEGLDPMVTGTAHLAVAFGAQLVGDFDGAVAAMVTAVPIIEQGGDWRMQVFAYNGQGQGAVLAGIPGLSAAMGHRILEVCDEHGQTLPKAYGLALLGEEEFFQGGDLAEAERRLLEAIPLFEAIGDEVAQNMFGLGILLSVEGVQGKFDAAERHAAEAATLGGPGWSATALIAMGAFVLIPRGDLDRAEGIYKRLIEISPDHPFASFDLGYIYIEKKQFDKAVELCQKAVEIDPGNIHAHHALGNIYKKSGRYEEALAELNKVLDEDPAHRYALWDIGEVYEMMGMKDKAQEQFKHYHEMTDCSFRRFWNCFD